MNTAVSTPGTNIEKGLHDILRLQTTSANISAHLPILILDDR